MARWQRRCAVALGFALAAGLSFATHAQTPPAPSAAQSATTTDRFPDAPAKPVLLRVCGNCHGPETVVERFKTRVEWSDTIDQMARFGAEATDAEFEQILAYLVKFFSTIRINKATAAELATTLDIPAAVAEAIVSYRTEKGPFNAIEDLKPVPGLDWSKIDDRKARLVFAP